MPEQTTGSPNAQRFVCPGCAAPMQFDPDSGKIKCPYCRQMQEPPPGSEIISHDYLEPLQGTEKHVLISQQAMEVQCSGCASTFSLQPPEQAGACSFFCAPIVA